MVKKYCTEKSRQLHEEAKKYLVNGVASSFQIPNYAEYPITMTHGKGSKLYDVDGNTYIDYLLGFGPVILGHAPESVGKAVAEQVVLGTQYSCPTEKLMELCKKLTEIIPCAEIVSFQNSGTEADMYVLRLVRAFTGRWKVVKFEGQYHGWSDEARVSDDADSVAEMGDRENPNKIIRIKGQRLNSADELYVLPWNDLEMMEKLFQEHGDEIAAVLMEPIMLDSGPILPKPGFLEAVRELTRKYNILLVFDEVITGFRVALGGAQEYYGVTPDVAVFAKAITSGYPFGVVAGRRDVMTSLKPAGTFNGNPVGTAAAMATITELEKPGTYEHMDHLTKMLADGFIELGKKHNVKVFARHIAGVFALYFGFEEDVADLREWLEKADTEYYTRFVKLMEDYGIRFSCKRGRIYVSTAHTEEDILHTLEVADQVMTELAAE